MFSFSFQSLLGLPPSLLPSLKVDILPHRLDLDDLMKFFLELKEISNSSPQPSSLPIAPPPCCVARCGGPVCCCVGCWNSYDYYSPVGLLSDRPSSVGWLVAVTVS
jgi:hypothetical protein